MNEFEKIVKKHYENLIPGEIDNGSIEHAKVLVKYLFKLAESKNVQDVKIVTGCLDNNFYSGFVDSAKKILKHSKISIISHNDCEEGEFKKVVNDSDKGEIYIVDDNVKSLPHFILIGDSAYRFENDDILKTAKASFNGESIAQFLNLLFDDIKTHSSLATN